MKPHNYKRGVIFPLPEKAFYTEEQALESAQNGEIVVNNCSDECLVASHYRGQVWVLDSFDIRKAMIEKYTTTEGKTMSKKTKAEYQKENTQLRKEAAKMDEDLLSRNRIIRDRMEEVDKKDTKILQLESELRAVRQSNETNREQYLESKGRSSAFEDALEMVTQTVKQKAEARKISRTTVYQG